MIKRTLAVLAAVLLVGVTAQPATAAVSMVAKIVQEPGEFEARFPDVVKLNDGRLMAVWHRAAEHAGTVGTIRLSFGSANGRTWSAAAPALANPGSMNGIDTRDPKLGKMQDGSVVMTFFVPGGKVYYSVWKPGWTRFTDPVQLTAPGLATGVYSHGSPLALADRGTHTDQVLIPVYTGGPAGGAHYIQATWRPTADPRLQVSSAHKIIGNSNPPGRAYQEPSFVQYGDTVVAVVRAEQNGNGSPAIIARWNPYTAKPVFAYQSFTGVLANSHHLLKTASGKLLFTYGDRARTGRPTSGMLIGNPTATWAKSKVLPLYNSGHGDQANPSSVEIAPGTFLTLGYNAKKKSASPSGGTLWVIESHASDY
ncbi:sialidase family protein [Allokutzneria sp. NRRL B-24872]|uniref:sialidase family protein n=1 Tax=Allokutzneria sp. NRRL B-24872 TaxID=1137961 RepID=UPI001AEF3D0D|nr:sialidase family protein [Allokutzneria sp. NRRL B-24872]